MNLFRLTNMRKAQKSFKMRLKLVVQKGLQFVLLRHNKFSTSYNVVVSQKLGLDDYWSIRDLSSLVSTINFQGINFFVLRYDLEQYERAVNATEWLKNKTGSISNIIK
jgi:hypothetical protein